MSLFKTIAALFRRAPRRRPAECFAAVRSGQALLVDVREPAEWESGVAAGAILLPLTDLAGGRRLWSEFIRDVGPREVLVYCQAGGRSALAARILTGEGLSAVNAGALAEWAAAGWPIAPPGSPAAAKSFTP
jgi:rhodanese-related sulfurtransferase